MATLNNFEDLDIHTIINQKQKLIKLFFSVLLIVLFSCKQTTNPPVTTQVLQLGSILENTSNDKVFKSVRYIKLETAPEILIGDNLYFEIKGDKLYILDREHQKSLLVFNQNGKFLHKVGNSGNGPGEYPRIVDFVLRNDTVDFLSPDGIHSTVYSYLLNGNFISKLELKHFAYSFQFVENKNYIISTNYNKSLHDHQVYLLDRVGNEVKKFLPNTTQITIPIGENCFSIFENQVYYFEQFNNKVYRFDNNELKPVYELDFGEYNVPEEFFKSDLIKGFELINKQGFALIKNVFVNKENIVFEVVRQKAGEPGTLFIISYNIKTGAIKHLAVSEKDYIFKYPVGLNNRNEMMYLVFPIGDVNKDFKRFGLSPNISGFAETDNPVIVFCKL